MKIANNLQRLVFIFLIAKLFFVVPVMALDNYKEFKRDHWDFEAATQFFYSDANHISFDGGKQSLIDGNYFQLLDFKIETRYMPQSNWSMFGWVNVGNSESSSALAKRTNSSVSEAVAGFDFLMYSDLFDIVPELYVLMPFEKVDPRSDTVLNSEGVIELRTRAVIQKSFGFGRLYGWLGFNYRAERSSLMPYGLGANFKVSRFLVGGEISGFQSVTSDSSENLPLRTGYINGVNAGSMKFYSVDPSLVDSQLYVRWLISKKWSVQASGGMTLAGENTASGYHVGAFIRYSFDFSEGYSQDDEPYSGPLNSPVPNYRSGMYEESEMSSHRKVEKFKEEIGDGVDQQVFKPQPTSKPKVIDQQLQQQLDNAEFEVELRSNKKKKRR